MYFPLCIECDPLIILTPTPFLSSVVPTTRLQRRKYVKVNNIFSFWIPLKKGMVFIWKNKQIPKFKMRSAKFVCNWSWDSEENVKKIKTHIQRTTGDMNYLSLLMLDLPAQNELIFPSNTPGTHHTKIWTKATYPSNLIQLYCKNQVQVVVSTQEYCKRQYCIFYNTNK